MLAPKMVTSTPSHREYGEIIVVCEIEFFWAPVLHGFNMPEPIEVRHPESYAIRRQWQMRC